MKTIVIIGAGQMGRAAAELLHPNKTRLLALGDNNETLWGSEIETGGSFVRICSVEEAVTLKPDEILISVLGEERAKVLAEQVGSLGYKGEIIYLKDIYNTFDIRSRCIGLLLARIRDENVPGAMAELGVYQGDTAWQMNAAMPDRTLYLFDTFQGFDGRDLETEVVQAGGNIKALSQADFSDTTAEAVGARMPHPENVVFCQGYFPETTKGIGEENDEDLQFAFVSLDPDLYAPTLAGLRYFYPRMSEGGIIVVHDYNNKQFEGVKRAVTEFEIEQGAPLHIVPLGDLHGSCVIMK